MVVTDALVAEALATFWSASKDGLPPQCLRGTSILAVAVKRFAAAHPELSTGKGAFDRCWEMTDAFLSMLSDMAEIPVPRLGCVVHLHSKDDACQDAVAADCGAYLVRRPLDKYPIEIDPDDGWQNHRYAVVGNIAIDWTARQFDAAAPWPMVWIELSPVRSVRSRALECHA